MIPLRYTLRSLVQRKARTLLTIAGIAATVFVFVAMTALSKGLLTSYQVTGEPDEVVILQKGAYSQEFSSISEESEKLLNEQRHIKHRGGEALISPELSLGSYVKTSHGGDENFIMLRGVDLRAFDVIGQVKLLKGVKPKGKSVTIGNYLAKKLDVGLGDRLYFENRWWTVGGIMRRSGTVFDQEIWADVDRLKSAADRDEYSCYTVKVGDPSNVSEFVDSIVDDPENLSLTAVPGREYYSESGTLFKILGSVGMLIGLIILTGSILAGMNTMYAAVSGRIREIGTLKALGYTRLSLLISFVCESLFLALTGGILGALLSFSVNGLPLVFPMITAELSISWSSIGLGIILSVVIGLAGGLLPALTATRVKTAEAVKSL